MILCKNCGAQYDKNKLACPYCECENVAATQVVYSQKLNEVIEEREQLKKLPGKLAGKKIKQFAIVLVLFVLVITVVVTGIKHYRDFGPQSKYQIEENNKEIMEQYLADKDYENLCEYYTTLDYSKSTYEKYAEIEYIYGYYEELQWRIGQIKYYFPSSQEKEQIAEITKAMQLLNKLYNIYDECMNDTRRLANEQYISEIWEMGKTDFMREYYADENMVSQVLELRYADTSDEYNELAVIFVNNLKEKLGE